MLAALNLIDLSSIFFIVAFVAWVTSLFSAAEDRTQRLEAKLDRILKHLGLDDDEPPPNDVTS